MKKDNYMLVIMVYAICIFFGIMTIYLPAKAKTYPAFVIILLLLLNTFLLIKTKLEASNVKLNTSEIVERFEKKQFFVVFATALIYIVMLNIVGFLISTIGYLLFCFFFFKIRKVTGIITCIGFTAVIYIIFSVLLKVPLPTGVFF